MELGKLHGTTHWQDAVNLEMQQLDEYDAFKDYSWQPPPLPGYNKIHIHLMFDVKHDSHHKAHCVAGGHLMYLLIVFIWVLFSCMDYIS